MIVSKTGPMLPKIQTEDTKLTVNEHLLELRKRLIVCTITVVMFTIVSFVFHPFIFKLLMGPAQGFESLLENKLVFTQVTEMIGITMIINAFLHHLSNLILAMQPSDH